MSEALTEHIVIEQFEGPFHTLVDLLESQKLDITSIALATVTEQYINAVNTQPYIDPYALADFGDFVALAVSQIKDAIAYAGMG